MQLSNANEHRLAHLLLCGTSIFIIGWFWFYFTDGPVASVDLPSHIALADSLRDFWWRGQWFFYDHATFTGYTALHFYGFLPALVTTLLSYPLQLISEEPVRLSAHVILVFGLALFPWSFWCSLRELVREVISDSAYRNSPLATALAAAVASFWFINHDDQWFGIGAAAVMNIGLFAQLFAWHFFLLFAADLLRLRRGEKGIAWLWLSALCITHLLTSIFAFSLMIFMAVWLPELRRGIVMVAVRGLGAVAFWLLPCLWYLGSYTAYDVFRPKGDLLEVFYRYPWSGLIQAAKSALAGHFSTIDITHFLWIVATLVLLGNRRFSHSRVFVGFTLFTFIGWAVFSSGFIATSIPLGIHYYRFVGYLFLLWLLVLTAVVAAQIRGGSFVRPWNVAWVIVLLSCFVSVLRLPHYERPKMQRHTTVEYLEDQEQVLNYFAGLPNKGRVYIEYLTDYSVYPPLSAHYIGSYLYKRTGFESGVASHLQESLSYRMYVASANLLDATTYNVPLLFTDRATGGDEYMVEQLKSFGFTHVVASTDGFLKKLEPYAIAPPQEFGVYRVIQLAPVPLVTIEPNRKILVGYRDEQGNLPFHLLQYYFYARAALGRHYELIDMSSSATEFDVELQLINSQKGVHAADQTLTIQFDNIMTLDHYNVHYPHNVELDYYRKVESYLDNIVRLARSLRELSATEPLVAVERKPSLHIVDSGQQMQLDDLVPGAVYRVNYSYAPYWRAEGGVLMRGSGERMFLQATSERALLSFSPWRAGVIWCGLIISLCAIAFPWIRRRARVKSL